MDDVERLLFQYQRVDETLYGSVYPLRVDAACAMGEIPLGKWQAPFIVSKQLGQHEIVYGSILYHMHEAARPIFRIGALQDELTRNLPAEIQSSIVESRDGSTITRTSPSDGFPAQFLYQQDEIIKDAILLSLSHVRTLVEIFSGKGNRVVSTFDYEGNLTGEVSMQQLLNALAHHRHIVVTGGFISDVFSGQNTRGLPNMFGTKVKVEELLTGIINFLEGITVNDYVGMVRGRLEGLTIDSEPGDIIFAHQNVYALTEIVRYRIGEAQFLPFQNYLFSQLTSDEKRELRAAGDKSEVPLTRRFNIPRFKIGSDLDARTIEVGVAINDKQERFEFSQRELFEKLTSASGSESLIPIERFRQRIDALAEPS